MHYDIHNIKVLRKRLGLTQTEFARESGVSQSLIAKIEAGKLDPTYSKVKQIFEALDRLSKRKELNASDVMQKNLVLAKPNDKIGELVKVMHRKGISQVPVVEGRKVIGLVTESRLLENMGKDINNLRARDVMEEAPPSVAEDAKISVLTSLIRHYPLLAVVRKGDIVGVVTKTDLLRNMV